MEKKRVLKPIATELTDAPACGRVWSGALVHWNSCPLGHCHKKRGWPPPARSALQPRRLRARTDTRHPPLCPAPSLASMNRSKPASFATTAPALTADAKAHAARRQDPETLRESWLPTTVSMGSNCELLPPRDPRPQPRVQNLPEGRVRANI